MFAVVPNINLDTTWLKSPYMPTGHLKPLIPQASMKIFGGKPNDFLNPK